MTKNIIAESCVFFWGFFWWIWKSKQIENTFSSFFIYFLMLFHLRRTSFSGHLLSPIYKSSLHITFFRFMPLLGASSFPVSCSVLWISYAEGLFSVNNATILVFYEIIKLVENLSKFLYFWFSVNIFYAIFRAMFHTLQPKLSSLK